LHDRRREDDGKSGRSPRIKVPTVTAAIPAPTSTRFDLTMSMSSPAGTWVNSPASPATVSTNPTVAGIQP
jgi:hypothetical protein